MPQPFHLAIPVHDLRAARGFYGELFDCTEGRSSDEPSRPAIRATQLDGGGSRKDDDEDQAEKYNPDHPRRNPDPGYLCSPRQPIVRFAVGYLLSGRPALVGVGIRSQGHRCPWVPSVGGGL